MISITGKIWKQQKVNKNLIEKVKQQHGHGNILSQLIISRNYDISEIYGINNYQKLANPLLEHYKKFPFFHEIDGSRKIDEISNEINTILSNIMN